MERRLHNIACFLLLLLVSLPCSAQQVPYESQAEKKFLYALEYFENESYYSAAKHFQELALDFPLNHRTTAAFVMAARAHLFAGAPTRSLRLLEDFRARFPDSRYLAESYIISAEASAAAASPVSAAEFYLRAMTARPDDRAMLVTRLRELPRVALTPYDRRNLENLLVRIEDPQDIRDVLGLTPGRADSTVRARSGTADRDAARDPVIIAVALPLQTADPRRALLVRDLRDGMLAALDLHARHDSYPVQMQVIDCGNRDSLRAALEQVQRNPRAVVLIAGAFSEDARSVCEIMGESEIGILLPTATADGLASYGSNIFQLNTPLRDRAMLMADYAFLELDAEEVLVLAPDTELTRMLAEAFTERCRKLGLQVAGTALYDPRTADVASACRRLGANARSKRRVLFAPIGKKEHIATVLKGAQASGCIDILLGAGNWNYPGMLKKQAGKLKVYFEADVAADPDNPEMTLLAQALARRSDNTVSREVLFGFDAMNIALKAAGSGPTTRREVRHRLQDLFHGLRGPVNFLDNRVNRSLSMYRYQNGTVTQLDSFFSK